MSETTKTSIFLALALVLVALAAYTRPAIPEIQMDAMIGKNLFPKFTNPLDVKKLEIVRQNASGAKEEFRIAELDGVWSIPSHDNYPADAKEQMGKVAEALADLNVVSVAGGEGVDATTLHSMYGVIDPDSEDASLGEGVGVKVTLTGDNDAQLVNLIVGKAVEAGDKSANPAGEEADSLRYARIPGQTPVYTVAIDPARFSTSFDQWIEKNLLDISTMDLKEIYIDEYSIRTEIQLTQRGPQQSAVLDLQGDMTLAYDGAKTGPEKWNLVKKMGFKGQTLERYEEEKLNPRQELNGEVLDGMVSALNDLKIVGVSKKPAELATALREGKGFQELMTNGAAPESLGKCGFFLVPLADPRGIVKGEMVRLLSNQGDVQLRMKDGIRYNLRFGDLTGTESELEQSESATETPAMGANRYLFVTAEFDPAMVREPEIQPLPEETAAGKEPSALTEEKGQIEKSNQREKDRYEREIAEGKKRAETLNARFADWYYIISEDVYKKIHLTGATVIRDKPIGSAPALPGTEGMFALPTLDETEGEQVEPGADGTPEMSSSQPESRSDKEAKEAESTVEAVLPEPDSEEPVSEMIPETETTSETKEKAEEKTAEEADVAKEQNVSTQETPQDTKTDTSETP